MKDITYNKRTEASSGADFKITNLTVGYMTDPIGIDTDRVRFGWQMQSVTIGIHQSAYEISVYDGDDAVWSSGKTESGASVGIEYGGKALENGTLYTWNVRVWDVNGRCVTSETAAFETGVTDTDEWKKAEFIALNKSSATPIFRTEQVLIGGELSSVRLYITALGVYKAFVNGREVSATEGEEKLYHHMNPGYGNGNVSLGYRTYDVTEHITSDRVALSAVLGTGWYNGMGTTVSSPALKALLVLSYANGKKQYICTNTTDWKGTLDGPITSNGVYYGEDYDATRAEALGDFSSVGYDDGAWVSEDIFTVKYTGEIRSRIGTVGRIIDGYSKTPVSVTLYRGEKKEDGHPGGIINVKEYYSASPSEDVIYSGAKHIKRDINGIFGDGITLKKGMTMIIDMGQNMSAVPELAFSADEGTALTLRFAEMLNDGSKVGTGATDADGARGTVYQKSIRGARSQVKYTFAGKAREQYRSVTSFFGYRYIELTATDDVTLYSAKSCALSSVHRQTGSIATNNENVNKLFSNILYGQLSNYFTTSTDCNQRDERLFWSGDTQAFAATGVYNFDSFAFFEELQAILNENAMIKGYVPAVADDLYGFFSNRAAGWSDVLVILPWTVYLQTGDRAVLENSYRAMTKYMKYLQGTERGTDQAPLSERNFGDWLSFQGTSVDVISDYYYAYVTDIMAKTASVLGKAADAEKYSAKFDAIKAKFLETHVSFDGGRLVIRSGTGETSKQFHYEYGKGGVWEDNSQTSLLWLLKLGFYDSDGMRDAAIRLLTENIRNESPSTGSIRSKYGKNTLAVGFLGSNVLLPVLSEMGEHDLAFDLLLQDDNPSWLFEVEAGATTVWERWNSFTPGKGFGDAEMNSFNHYAYGSVAEWMYRYMLGIDHSESAPGYKSIVLQPTLDCGEKYNDEARIGSVSGSYDSLYGRISVSHKSDGGALESYSAVIPANTSAVLYLPVSEAATDGFTAVRGVTLEGMCEHNGDVCAKITLLSGGYDFTVTDGKLTVSPADGFVTDK